MIAPPLFALRVGLGRVPAGVEEVRHEIGDQLDAYEAQVVGDDAELGVLLTIGASDVWVAVLLAMAAVHQTGYPVTELEARPLERVS